MTVSMDKKYVTRDGLYGAKVIYIHDKGDQPVIVLAEYKRDLASNTVFRTQLNGKVWHDAENGFDLIEVPEDNPSEWVEFDAENDEVPFLHMHDMIDVKFINGIDLSSPVPAWSVDFDTSRDPVVAYRVVKKAEHPEKKSLPIEVFVDVAEMAERKVFHGEPRAHECANTAREAAVRAALKLAGVKV